MVLSSRSHTDKTVLLQKTEHPFIQHDSNVDFSATLLVQDEILYQAVRDGQCHPQSDVDPAILHRVKQGLLVSTRTVHWVCDYCRPLF